MRVGRALALIASCGLVAGVVMGCGGGGGSSGAVVTSDPESGVYAGTVVDESGAPVAGATVTVEGVEASSVTGADGRFVVSDSSLAVVAAAGAVGVAAASAPVEVTVTAPGFGTVVERLGVASGSLLTIPLFPSAVRPELAVTSPAKGEVLVIPEGCASPTVLVEGYATLGSVESLRLDVVVVVDRSGSTVRPAFDVDGDGVPDSVLDAEVSAVRCLLDTLDPAITRVALVAFEDDARRIRGFTNDLEAVAAALDEIGGPSGGTNYEAALEECRRAFVELAEDDAELDAAAGPGEADAPESPAPRRAVVLLTDGIPTSHGVPRVTSDSNLTQSFEDRRRAIEAAERLGDETGARLHAYSILSSEDTNRRRTTLPHCVAVCGGGEHVNVSRARDLSSRLCGEPLESVLSVEVRNVQLGVTIDDVAIGAGGRFSTRVPVGALGSVGTHGTYTNVIQVRVAAYAGKHRREVQETRVVRVLEARDFANLDDDELSLAQSDSTRVADLPRLESPEGKPLVGGRLRKLLVGESAAEFEDAVELHGVEAFEVDDPTGSGSGSVELEIDLVHHQACYRSDFGYVVFDAAAPPRSAEEALLGGAEAAVILHTGELVDAGGCDVGVMAHGERSFRIDAPVGTVVAFFVIPNGTLEDYRANPRSSRAPLFTVASWNPGGFDQCLTFRSLRGRTAPGPDLDVVEAGPLTVFAFEDLSVAGRRSDQDFDDLVFTVRSGLIGRVDELRCD